MASAGEPKNLFSPLNLQPQTSAHTACTPLVKKAALSLEQILVGSVLLF